MIEHIETIKKMHGKTWHYRGLPELAAVWPTPSPKWSLRFAMSESGGELMEAAYLRNGEFARNNTKQPDVLEELADTGMMLCTALGPIPIGIEGESISVKVEKDIDTLCFVIARANMNYGKEKGKFMGMSVLVDIYVSLGIVCHLFAERDADPVAYVEAKLQRTYNKFVV